MKMNDDNKIEIKHFAFLVLPFIVLAISIYGALLCFLEEFPASGGGWMSIFGGGLTVLAIPIFSFIACLIGGLICILYDKAFKPKIRINKFWISILIIAISSPLWTFIVSPVLFGLGGVVNTFLKIRNIADRL